METGYEKIFETEKGSKYYFNKEKGLWLRHHYEGEILRYEFNVGTLELAHAIKAREDFNSFIANLERGLVKGFTPDFVLGKFILGFDHISRPLIIKDIREVGIETIHFENGLVSSYALGTHVGDKITKIHKEINIFEYWGEKLK